MKREPTERLKPDLGVHIAEYPAGLGQHPPSVRSRKPGELLGQILAVDTLGDEIRRDIGVGVVLVDRMRGTGTSVRPATKSWRQGSTANGTSPCGLNFTTTSLPRRCGAAFLMMYGVVRQGMGPERRIRLTEGDSMESGLRCPACGTYTAISDIIDQTRLSVPPRTALAPSSDAVSR